MAEPLRNRRAILRFALAHHPTCSRFRHDVLVVRMGGRKAPLCAGCVGFWPALLLGLPAMFWAAKAGAPWWQLGLLGIAAASAQVASLAGLLRSSWIRVAVKALLGIGAAATLVALAVAPFHPALRIAVGLALAGAGAALQTRRLRNLFATCAACPWRKGWQHCPGFAPLNDHDGIRLPPFPPGPEGLPMAWPWLQGERRP